MDEYVVVGAEGGAQHQLLKQAGDGIPKNVDDSLFADDAEWNLAAMLPVTATELRGHAVLDADLLEETTALVEWPVAVTGSFEAKYLKLPDAVLTATLKGQQRYFPVMDDKGALLPNFVAIPSAVTWIVGTPSPARRPKCQSSSNTGCPAATLIAPHYAQSRCCRQPID